MGEVLGVNSSGKPIAGCQLALPFAKDGVALLPIVLLGRGELLGVVRLRLAGVQWLGDGEHGLQHLTADYRGRSLSKRSYGRHNWHSAITFRLPFQVLGRSFCPSAARG